MVSILEMCELICQIGFSKARPLIQKHDIKTRTFYGNTSMEAEMGFLMAGQALVGRQYLLKVLS
jgi:hypothetical protein